MSNVENVYWLKVASQTPYQQKGRFGRFFHDVGKTMDYFNEGGKALDYTRGEGMFKRLGKKTYNGLFNLGTSFGPGAMALSGRKAFNEGSQGNFLKGTGHLASSVGHLFAPSVGASGARMLTGRKLKNVGWLKNTYTDATRTGLMGKGLGFGGMTAGEGLTSGAGNLVNSGFQSYSSWLNPPKSPQRFSPRSIKSTRYNLLGT